VEATRRAFASDPRNAEKLNPDRIHPAPGGQLLMAAALLKAWHAPALVSRTEVKVDAPANAVTVAGKATLITDAKLADGLPSWTQRDDALPFPIDLRDTVIDLAVRSSTVVADLDEQPLKVSGLSDGEYVLKVDGDDAGTFTAEQLDAGVNL